MSEDNYGKKSFLARHKMLDQLHKSSMRLNTKLGQLPKGQVLNVVDHSGNPVVLNPKDRAEINARYRAEFNKLKEYRVIARKEPKTDKEKADQRSALKGRYRPVYVGEAVKKFLAVADLGAVKGKLPLAQQGYLLRDTLDRLMFYNIAIEDGGLQKGEKKNIITPSGPMRETFDKIPALYNLERSNASLTKKKPTFDKIPNPKKLTAFQVMSFAHPKGVKTVEKKEKSKNADGKSVTSKVETEEATGFNPDGFLLFYLTALTGINTWKPADLEKEHPKTVEFFAKAANREAMLAENELVSEALKALGEK